MLALLLRISSKIAQKCRCKIAELILSTLHKRAGVQHRVGRLPFFMSPHPSKAPCPVSRARVPLLVGKRGTRHNRIWDEARPNLGRETPGSAPRCGRLWGQTRLPLGRRTLKSLREGLAARQEGIGAKGEQMRPRKRYVCKNNFPTTRKYLTTKRVHLRENM